MHLNYPKHLPISSNKHKIIQAIQEYQVVIIAGDTGSGKTTQLPKMCLEAGRGRQSLIGCTQPRRIAAVSVAERVREEPTIRDLVGYKIRFHDHTGPTSRIKFMTDGILLAETRTDRNLNQYDTLIIDEAHERSLNIDFLLGYLHQLLQRRRELKLIISSATIDTEKFSHHFADAPIIEVSGRTYPISYHYEEADPDLSDNDLTVVERAVNQVCILENHADSGDILVFMPTERDILDTVSLLNKRLHTQPLVLPLFGRLKGADQRRIFKPSRQQKIIVATNIAETSITVPGIRTVVDTGLARIAHYNVRAGTTSLPVTRISQAGCDQRAGRCGRTGPGTCIRLYSEEDYLTRPRFTLPELLRSNLAEVILQMISLRLGDPRKFPFIEPPSSRAIHDGYRILRELGAITGDNRLTSRGRIMAGLPLDPRISRMIIEGAEVGALREVTIIAAVLSIQDPRIRPMDNTQQAEAAQRPFLHPGSDVLTFVNIWESCRQAMEGEHPSAGLRKFCKKHFCSWQRMREWFDIHDQILRTIGRHKGFVLNTDPAPAAAVHQALTAGFLRNIGLRKKKNMYQVSGNREVVLFPGSGLHNRGGQWIVAADFVKTSQLFARMVATIDPAWLERLGGDLCKRSWSDPHWQKKTGQVVALEKVTLFGLVLVVGRRINYGRINEKTAREAKEIFIREGLISGNLKGRYPFLQHNLALAERFADMEKRVRRRGIIMDEQVLYRFYEQRLGPVYDRFTLNRLLKKTSSDTFLWMQEDNICRALPDSDELYRFPDTLRTGRGEVRLHYHFQPGHEKDGVTADIPVHYYPDLSSSLFEWLVPGLLEDKIFYLLKGLPKRLRKLFVPLPDAVDRIMDGLDLYQGSLYEALERSILRNFQVTITRSDWQFDNLPHHLRMRFQLLDRQGKILHQSRSFHDLAAFSLQRKTASSGDPATIPEKKNIMVWEFSPAPQPVCLPDADNSSATLFFPALYPGEDQQSLTLKYINDPEQARQQNVIGLRLLYSLQFSRECKALHKECRAALKSHFASWVSLGMQATATEISRQLLECILDGLFQTTDGELPDTAACSNTIKRLKSQGMVKSGRQYLNRILELVTTRRKVQVSLTQCRQRADTTKEYNQSRFDHYQKLLDQLLPAHFLTTISPDEVRDRQRYLQALALRIERAEHAPEKDAQKARRIHTALERLQQSQKKKHPSPTCRHEITVYERMVEEFRVSIFAPELGTAFPISEKRLQRQWQQLENSCRTME